MIHTTLNFASKNLKANASPSRASASEAQQIPCPFMKQSLNAVDTFEPSPFSAEEDRFLRDLAIGINKACFGENPTPQF